MSSLAFPWGPENSGNMSLVSAAWVFSSCCKLHTCQQSPAIFPCYLIYTFIKSDVSRFPRCQACSRDDFNSVGSNFEEVVESLTSVRCRREAESEMREDRETFRREKSSRDHSNVRFSSCMVRGVIDYRFNLRGARYFIQWIFDYPLLWVRIAFGRNEISSAAAFSPFRLLYTR